MPELPGQSYVAAEFGEYQMTMRLEQRQGYGYVTVGVFCGKGPGQRGKAGHITLRGEEWERFTASAPLASRHALYQQLETAARAVRDAWDATAYGEYSLAPRPFHDLEQALDELGARGKPQP